MSDMTLEVSDLAVEISTSMALRDINLALDAGSVTVIIGPNGAGKTSLLRAICNDLELIAGSIVFDKQPMHAWSVQERAKCLAILPQRSSLEFPFTVNEVVSLGRIPHSTSHRHNQDIVRQALELVDCSQFADRFYINLSGGEKQRVQLARVAAQIWEEQDNARCLILDEPSSSLDLAHQAMIVDIVQYFAAQGVAILTVLHDLNLASKCANTLVTLSDGEIVSAGNPTEVLTESMLRDVFGIEATISQNERDGSLLVAT
ncbi:MAG: heme ABC transporter ATP-binding protein [Pseudomonadales bacterium]|nr:heme ABC transporter ATP-binding protein [Pseudomonadales bacterium]